MRISSSDGSAIATFCLSRGGRLASLLIDGREYLITADDAAFGWGAYPMVPYAGRVRRGRFTFQGKEVSLPITMAPHAIHGVAWEQAWTVSGEPTASSLRMSVELGEAWPLGGTVTQSTRITDDELHLTLEVTAGERSMPAMAGWHPWFRRHIGDSSAELVVQPASMFELDDEAIPTGALVAPPPGPWDNCFELDGDPRINWPGLVELQLASSHNRWVIYDQPAHAVCVEPQTDAPDAFNRSPHVLEPGETLATTFVIRWTANRESAA